MVKFGVAVSAGLMATLLLAGNPVPSRAHSPAQSHFQDVRLKRILGMAVEDLNAVELGTVKDLVLNVPKARIEYVIVSSNGFLGVGTQQHAVPAPDLSPATILRGTLSTSLTKTQWENAPEFHSEIAALAHPLEGAGPRQDARTQPSGSGPAPAQAKPSATGRQASNPGPSPTPNADLQFGRKLLGTLVLDAQGQKLGRITDMLVDLTGAKPPVVIICSRRFLHRELCGAVPLAMLNTRGNKLVVETNRRRMEQAPWFTEQAWQTAVSPGASTIYRVPGSSEG
jgi:sporulation protein YlmC with PRC-barrel domain